MPFNPDKITRADVLKAVDIIEEGDYELRPSTGYDVIINGKTYPPKEVMRYAHEVATGEYMWNLSGGEPTNKYLKDMGFTITYKRSDVTDTPIFTWIPAYETITENLLQYENRQQELIDLLQSIGITNFTDQDANGNSFPLSEIDPLSFLCYLNKYGDEKRLQYLRSLCERWNITPLPEDVKGIPNVNAQRVWLFQYKRDRNNNEIQRLWNYYKALLSNTVTNALFADVLKILGVGKPKLTEGMFMVNPHEYLCMNGVVNPYLQSFGLSTEFSTYDEYIECIQKARQELNKSYPEISHEAYLKTAGAGKPPVVSMVNEAAAEYSGSKNTVMTKSLNTILYGPPGTGKTYHTINKSVDIANPEYDMGKASREQLKAEYERLVKEGQIEFVTFHQGMSYEDFIEGIKPVEPKEEDEFLKYEIKDGIFKRLCERAAKVPETKAAGFSITEEEFQRAGFYKMSLGDTSNPDDDQIYEWCIKNGYIALGRGDANDFTGLSENDIQQMVPGQLEKFSAQALNYFIHYAKVGDYVIVSYGNLQFRAVGKISGGYEFKNVEGLQVHQFRKVEWVWSGSELPYEEIYDRQFSQQSIYKMDKRGIKKEFLIKEKAAATLTYDSLYKLFLEKVAGDLKEHSNSDPLFFDGRKSKIQILRIQDERIISIGESANTEEPIYKERLKMIYDRYNFPEDIKNIMELREISTAISWTSNYYAVFKALKEFEASLVKSASVRKEISSNKNYVLIIDEINRGNVSQIFGELITLVEEDKRAGKDEALTVTLPYSKKPFAVPSNLYIIGTMNTADRSVEALDTALRRRFSFEAMLPDATLITESPAGIDLPRMLAVINDRLEALLSKDHTIGHAWLMKINTLEKLQSAFKNKILPLLQEFFYNDYAKIGLVLGDAFVKQRKVERKLFASFTNENELAGEYEDKIIYTLANPSDLVLDDFTAIYQ